jgi:predicted XRE-type DNA-binding protein
VLRDKQESVVGRIKSSRLDKVKVDICCRFIEYKKKHKLPTQQALADKLKLHKYWMSLIMQKKVERYSVDKLLTLLWKIEPEMYPVLKKISKAKKKKNKN